MKKLIFLLVMLGGVIRADRALLLNENFNNGMAGAGWDVKGLTYKNYGVRSCVVIKNNDVELTSPEFNLTGLSMPELDYVFHLSGGGSLQAYISINGVDWEELSNVAANGIAWQNETLDLSPYAGKKCRLKFTGTVKDSGNIFIDYIRLTGYNEKSETLDKKYSETAFLTTHNSYNDELSGYYEPDMYYPLNWQLQMGVRGFMLDVYDKDGEIVCYHGESKNGWKPLSLYLGYVKTFLDKHPQEIVTLIFECYINNEAVNKAFKDVGLLFYLYSKPKDGNWPALKEMINSGQRLVVMSDRNEGVPISWYHYMWDIAVETHWFANSRSDFSSKFNRGKAENDLFILNHFIKSKKKVGTDIPDSSLVVNSNPYFLNRCLKVWQETGKVPNFVTVDFPSLGDAVGIDIELNNYIWDQVFKRPELQNHD
jgi:hypothetical protein